MNRLAGLLLNAAGVALLWFGGIPYRTEEKPFDLEVLKHEVDRKLVVPPYVGAGMVAAGSVLLLGVGAGRKKS